MAKRTLVIVVTYDDRKVDEEYVLNEVELIHGVDEAKVKLDYGS